MKLIRIIHNGLKRRLYKSTKGFYRAVSSKKETKKTHIIGDNKYLLQRRKLHYEIINSLIDNTVNQKNNSKPTAFFIGGGSATGKTTLREKIVKEKIEQSGLTVVTVDPDYIKCYIPEYEQFKKSNPQTAASLVHKESCDIRDLLVERLIINKMPFVYEGTMSKPKKYKKLFFKLIQQGYAIHLYIADVPVAIAKYRAKERAKLTGRTIPVKVIENTHKLVPKTFLAVRNLTDSYHVYDNQQTLELMVSKVVRNKRMYESFLKKATASEI